MSASPWLGLLAYTSADDGWIGRWSPGIGDPTFIGWFTVVAYLFAAYQCRRVYRRLPGPKAGDVPAAILALAPIVIALLGQKRRVLGLPPRVRAASLWLGFAIVLLLLGINKQLDLQTAITEIGRGVVREMGWSAIHRVLQVGFIVVVLVAGAWMLRAVLLLAHGSIRRMLPALLGTVFILCFVGVRATSFHHIDHLLGASFAGFTLNWVLELGGIALIIHGALRELRALGAVRRAAPPGSTGVPKPAPTAKTAPLSRQGDPGVRRKP